MRRPRRSRCSTSAASSCRASASRALLDAGAPWLELSSLAGYCLDDPDPEKTVPGRRHGGRHRLCVGRALRWWWRATPASTPARSSPWGARSCCARRSSRWRTSCRSCTWSNRRAPTCSSTASRASSTAARIFDNLAQLSAAGLPVVTVVHGSSTAGGAYMPGLSDYVIMVRGRAKAFLAGPPLLKAATGEIATDEELGGAEMHTHVSGLGEYLAENDADGIRCAREVLCAPRLEHQRSRRGGKPPRYDAEELLGVMPEDYRKPVRHARGHRADRRRLRLPRVQARLRAGDRVRPRRGAGLSRRHRQQQRPDRPGGREQGDALHPALLPGGHADPLPAEHHRLHRRQGRGSRPA